MQYGDAIAEPLPKPRREHRSERNLRNEQKGLVATLHDLDEPALVRILREPKNAIVKQYQKYFDLEKVRLKFTDDAVAAVAREAMKRGTGARGLRAVLEEVMLEMMYELPSMEGVRRCVVTADVIRHGHSPLLLSRSDRDVDAGVLEDAHYLPESA